MSHTLPPSTATQRAEDRALHHQRLTTLRRHAATVLHVCGLPKHELAELLDVIADELLFALLPEAGFPPRQWPLLGYEILAVERWRVAGDSLRWHCRRLGGGAGDSFPCPPIEGRELAELLMTVADDYRPPMPDSCLTTKPRKPGKRFRRGEEVPPSPPRKKSASGTASQTDHLFSDH